MLNYKNRRTKKKSNLSSNTKINKEMCYVKNNSSSNNNAIIRRVNHIDKINNETNCKEENKNCNGDLSKEKLSHSYIGYNQFLNKRNVNYIISGNKKNLKPIPNNNDNRINRIKYNQILKSQSIIRKTSTLNGFNSALPIGNFRSTTQVNAVNGDMPVSLYRNTYPNNKKYISGISKTSNCNIGFNTPKAPTISGSSKYNIVKTVNINLIPNNILMIILFYTY